MDCMTVSLNVATSSQLLKGFVYIKRTKDHGKTVSVKEFQVQMPQTQGSWVYFESILGSKQYHKYGINEQMQS